MLKPLKRLLASTAAALSLHPVTRAAVPEPTAATMNDADVALREIEYDMNAVVRPEMLKRYSGPRTELTPELLAQIRSAKRWRNGCITAASETEEFVRERTR